MFSQLSSLEKVALRPFKFPFLAINPMTSKKRLGNPALDFPIGITFGEHDYFGSEGSAQIILKNKHFSTGKSQLMTVKNSTHYIPSD